MSLYLIIFSLTHGIISLCDFYFIYNNTYLYARIYFVKCVFNILILYFIKNVFILYIMSYKYHNMEIYDNEYNYHHFQRIGRYSMLGSKIQKKK